jgi:periplasmic protein TonB
MEQPIHSIRGASANRSRNTIALTIAVFVNVLVAWALNAGLIRTLVEKLPDVIKVDVVKEIPDKTPPPPPPPDTAEPPPPFVPPPDFTIANDAPAQTNSITVQSKVPPPIKQLSSPASIGRPHTCGQDYPALSLRLGEQGTTVLSFHISVDGSIKDIGVATTSGSERLDEAAVKCAARWRYKPAVGENGSAIEVPWKAQVVWDLKNR